MNEGFNFYDSIDSIYYINLSDRPEKNKSISGRLKQYFGDKNIVRFNAVSKHTVEQYRPLFEKKLIRDSEYLGPDNEILLPGVIACYLSHFLVLKEIQKKIEQKPELRECYFPVFEDDTFFDHQLPDLLKNMQKYLPGDWTIIHGLNEKSTIFEEQEKHKKNEYLCSIAGLSFPLVFGNNLLIYNSRKIDYIIKKIEDNPILFDYDGLLYSLFDNLYCLKKGYVSSCDQTSDTRPDQE